jgi:hypothetical protein
LAQHITRGCDERLGWRAFLSMATPIKKYRQQVQSVDACQYDGSEESRQVIIEFTNGKAEVTGGGNFVLHGIESTIVTTIHSTDWITKDAWGLCNCRKDADFQIIYAPGPS